MEINLEKIELVKDRTGCTYAEAKEALEGAEGSVVDAIIAIEEKMNREYNAVDGESLKDSPVFAKMKEIVDKGNVTRILISKNSKTIVNFPLTAGVIGAVLVPWGAILGIVAAMGAQCDIEFVDERGEVIDINGKVVGIYDKAKGMVMKGVDKAQSAFGNRESAAGSAREAVEEVVRGLDGATDRAAEKINETADAAADKVDEIADRLDDVKDAFEKGASRLMDAWDKLEKSGKIEEVMGSIDKMARKAAETVKKVADDVADVYKNEDAEKAAEEEFKDEEDL